MIHNELEQGGHYGVSLQADKRGVLLQLGDAMDGQQARVCLTVMETMEVIGALRRGLSALLTVRAADTPKNKKKK